MGNIKEAIVKFEEVALEMEKSIDSLMITIDKGDKLNIEFKKRSDFPEICHGLRDNVIVERVQEKIDTLSDLM